LSVFEKIAEQFINFVDEKPKRDPKPFGWRKLFKKPVIRQFMKDGSIWREREEREPSRSEVPSFNICSDHFLSGTCDLQLFFDLIFVGIIRQLTDGATEEFSARNVAKFGSLFPSPSTTVILMRI